MAKWVKLTDYNGTPIWANLDVASYVIRYAGYDTTNVTFPAGEKGSYSVIVKETPEEIFALASRQNWG